MNISPLPSGYLRRALDGEPPLLMHPDEAYQVREGWKRLDPGRRRNADVDPAERAPYWLVHAMSHWYRAWDTKYSFSFREYLAMWLTAVGVPALGMKDDDVQAVCAVANIQPDPKESCRLDIGYSQKFRRGAAPNEKARAAKALQALTSWTQQELQVRSKWFHDAVFKGELDDAKRYVRSGVDVNFRNPAGRTALHCVSSKAMTDLLIKAGADVDASDNSGQRPLHGVLDGDVARAIIAAGADLEAIGCFGDTPLLSAAGGGLKDVVDALIESGANLEAKGSDGATALWNAIRAVKDGFGDDEDESKHLYIAVTLIDAGANFDARLFYDDGDERPTPRELAEEELSDEQVGILIRRAAAYKLKHTIESAFGNNESNTFQSAQDLPPVL